MVNRLNSILPVETPHVKNLTIRFTLIPAT
jgi:hypothetical protein